MEMLIILVLILLNGVFSMSEIAMVSARKSRLEAAAKRGDRRAKAALETANNPNRFLSTVQIGITLIGIFTGIFSGENITEDVREFYAQLAVPIQYTRSLAVVTVVLIITFLSLVLGELVPKRIGLTNPEGIAKIVALPMQWLTLFTSPFVWLLTLTSDMLITIFRIKPSTDSKVTEEEIKAIIQEGADGGAVQEIEQDIMERVFNLGDRNVSSLMTHRSDIAYLRIDDNSADIRHAVNKEMHSLYPVYEHEKDNLIGVVYLKELFRHINDADFSLRQHVQDAYYVTENLSAYETLKQFKSTQIHYAIVIDEFGHTQGLVTMNDLLEALVGDVSDFYAEEFSFVERADGSWLIDGQFPLPEFLSKFDQDDLISDYPFNTLSGLILHELKTIPKPGQKMNWLNFEIEVMDMDRARIDKVLIRKK